MFLDSEGQPSSNLVKALRFRWFVNHISDLDTAVHAELKFGFRFLEKKVGWNTNLEFSRHQLGMFSFSLLEQPCVGIVF